MVHGNCLYVGCYAMTNHNVEEIYLLVEAALQNGQTTVPVHIFPFEMTQENLSKHAASNWQDFWRNLKQGYDLFEQNHTPTNRLNAKRPIPVQYLNFKRGNVRRHMKLGR